MTHLMHQLTKLAEATRLLNSAKSLTSFYETVFDLIKDIFDNDTAAILFVDNQTNSLKIEAARGYNLIKTKSISIKPGMSIAGRVWQTGEPLIISETDQIPDHTKGVKNSISEMAVPLIAGNKIVGVLDMESATSKFSTADLSLFTTLGDQIITAYENLTLKNSLKARAEKLNAINRAANALNTIYDPDKVISEILSSICKAFNVKECGLLLLDEDDKTLSYRASIGYKISKETKIPINTGITGAVAATGQPVLVADSSKDPRYADINNRKVPVSEMAVPLIINDKIIGVLDTEDINLGYFTNDDLELFATFASHASIAIHNANLIQGLEEANNKLAENYEEMKHLNEEMEEYAKQIALANKNLEWQVKQLTAVHQAGRTITSSLDLDTTLKTILSMSSQIVGSSSSAIKLINDETKAFIIHVEHGEKTTSSGSKITLKLPLRIGDNTIGIFEFIQSKKLNLTKDQHQMLETMASQAAIAIENDRLLENTQRVYYETLKTLAGTIEARDDYTRGHSERVAKLSKMLASQMGLSKKEITDVFNAALLHDIGKIGIRDEVLLAPRSLTDNERAIIQQHPSYGNTILSPLKFLGEIRKFVRYHHERWDGKGYPEGRKGTEIPLASRIISVADSFDAMTSTRPYRKAMEVSVAINKILEAENTQFDPDVVKAFKIIMRIS
jgi:putative nucleotidyltransferase with HDIG domain